MNPEAPLHRRAAAIFDAAITLTHTAEREELLARECLGDLVLEQRVRALLRAHEEAGSFLEQPNAQLAAELERLRPEEAGERIGHYKLLQQIGERGFGTVWMAEQEQPVRRRVALKIIKLGMDTKEVIARFEQERQALALMDHPNIARVFDAGATPFGRPFFVMELVRGVRITDYCDEQQLPTHERLELFIQAFQAVQHAHQKGIIHRDIKPSNILVTINDGVAVPKVIDFGVAKATQGRLVDSTVFTRFEQMIGTPLYMSPEQAEMTSLDIDTRSDIYSLGVLLYELLTGRNKGGKDVEKTILQTNLEAADAMARQMRLRNIGGLIIGDFIDMKSRKDQQQVYQRMKERLRRDKAKTHVLPISPLGLMEMTRQRAAESISGAVFEPCPYCHGRGKVKSAMTMSVELQRELHLVMRKHQENIHEIRVIVHPHVMQRLRTEDEELLVDIERKYAGRLTFRSDPTFHHEKFMITDANSGQELKG